MPSLPLSRLRRPLQCATALLVVFAFLLVRPLRAVEVSGGFNTTAPSAANIQHWAGGWPGPGLSGWDYVGQVGGASATYLGNGWVITAAHVGVGDLFLNGVFYSAIGGSAALINGGEVDLVLFQIASPPGLPPLSLGQLPPVPFSASSTGDAVALVGFGGSQGKTWGLNTVNGVNLPIELLQYNSIDFYTIYGTTTAGGHSVTNNARAISGDSGGGGFIYHAATGKWDLAGIMEATGDALFLVQISAYLQQILDITGLPAPPVIASQPVGASVNAGASATLSVTANGTSPLAYQWQKNGVLIPGATTATLAFQPATSGDSGSYRVTVTNDYGSITSSAATLTVATPVPALPAWALAILPVLLFTICRRRLRRA